MISFDGVSFDLRKSAIILTHDLLARGFTAARWTRGRSARPRTCPNLTLK